MPTTKNSYILPFDKEKLIRAASDLRAHFAHFKYAIDFCLPEGTTLVAPKGGTVVDIKVDSREGSSDPRYNDAKYANYMTIKQGKKEATGLIELACGLI